MDTPHNRQPYNRKTCNVSSNYMCDVDRRCVKCRNLSNQIVMQQLQEQKWDSFVQTELQKETASVEECSPKGTHATAELCVNRAAHNEVLPTLKCESMNVLRSTQNRIGNSSTTPVSLMEAYQCQ